MEYVEKLLEDSADVEERVTYLEKLLEDSAGCRTHGVR